MKDTKTAALTELGIAQLEALTEAFSDVAATEYPETLEELLAALNIASLAARRLRLELQVAKRSCDAGHKSKR